MKALLPCFLLLILLYACDLEEDLTFVEVEDRLPSPVLIEENRPKIMRHTFNGDEAIDTTGQVLSMGNDWYRLHNFVVDTNLIECSTTVSGTEFMAEEAAVVVFGGNFQRRNLNLVFKLNPDTTNFSALNFIAYFVPDNIGSWSYGPICSQVTVTIDELGEDYIVGTFTATISKQLDPGVPILGSCEDNESLLTTATLSGEFDLPLIVTCR